MRWGEGHFSQRARRIRRQVWWLISSMLRLQVSQILEAWLHCGNKLACRHSSADWIRNRCGIIPLAPIILCSAIPGAGSGWLGSAEAAGVLGILGSARAADWNNFGGGVCCMVRGILPRPGAGAARCARVCARPTRPRPSRSERAEKPWNTFLGDVCRTDCRALHQSLWVLGAHRHWIRALRSTTPDFGMRVARP